MKTRIGLRRIGDPSLALRILVPILSVLCAFIFCAILFQVMGYNSLQIYGKLLESAFTSVYGIQDTLVYSITLMFCALGISIAFKMKIWNIGAEGQICLGALFSTGAALFCPWIPEPLLLPAVIVAGFIGGALWAIISILPNALWGVNETIITLLMNYVAIFLINYFVYGPWRDPEGLNFPLTAKVPECTRLPKLFGTNIHAGFILAVVLAVILYFVLKRTSWGYQISVTGQNRLAAVYGGINVKRNIVLVMLLSGGICGLAGMAQITGITLRMQPNLSGGYGYMAITIAYLSRFNPLLVVIVSILFGGLVNGGFSLQMIGLPSEVVTMMQGAILFFVLGGEFFCRYSLYLKKDNKEGELT